MALEVQSGEVESRKLYIQVIYEDAPEAALEDVFWRELMRGGASECCERGEEHQGARSNRVKVK